jgi:hypothetical protein
LLMPWTFKPTFRNGFNILSIRMMPDIRSGGNECFSDLIDFYRICPSYRRVWESLGPTR